ncbi:MAG: DUF4240 domain-containing protein [Planctomycetes bacterium]|nr:DUF4240 domain-containing protein [Planctomycetota bacterium]
MTEQEFWKLIDGSRKKGNGDLDEQSEQLRQALSKLTSAELVAFDHALTRLQFQAYTWELWGAAYLINGGCSDDGFDYFTNWLIAQGEQVYREALKSPDSLVTVAQPDDEHEFEELSYLAHELYEEQNDDDIPESGLRRPGSPAGDDWDFDDDNEMSQRYPKLWAKFSDA